MSFWRKLNNAIFRISLVLSCLAVVAGAIWGFSLNPDGGYGPDYSWLGLVILVGGTTLILITFSTWGIVLEYLDNVADIRNAVCSGQRSLSKQVLNVQSNQSVQQANLSGQASNVNMGSSSSQETPVAQAVNTEQVTSSKKWTCTGCNKNNDADSLFCYNCGKPKE